MKDPRLDKLGRVVIPAPYRRALNIVEGDPLVISLDAEGAHILIRAKRAVCRLCGAEVDARSPVPLCADCISAVKKI